MVFYYQKPVKSFGNQLIESEEVNLKLTSVMFTTGDEYFLSD